MLPKVISWSERVGDAYLFYVDKELVGYPIFYIDRECGLAANCYFVLRKYRSPQGKRLRRLLKEGKNIDLVPNVTFKDEEKLVSGGVTNGEGIELRVCKDSMDFISLELMLGKDFASFVGNDEIQSQLNRIGDARQPIFSREFWAPELVVRGYMRADCRKISGLLSSDSLMMTWCLEVEWHRISDWLYIATNEDKEFSGFAAINLNREAIYELEAVNKGHPIPPEEGK
jgi:hypothetical protein